MSMLLRATLPTVLFALVLGAPKDRPQRRAPAGKPVAGIAIHFCSCTAPCPCMFNPNDMESCDLVAVYHFTDGGYVGKSLNGQTVVVAYRPTKLRESKEGLRKGDKPVDSVLYLPQQATAQQARDLQFALAEHMTKTGWSTQLVRRAAITFKPIRSGYEVAIPGVLHAATKAMPGVDGKQLEVRNVDFAEGDRWLLGKSSVHEYTDPEEKEWRWSLPNTNGTWTKFVWTEIDHGP